jgi:biopolymer transport protein ExbD
MPKVKVARKSTFVDMTAMCDVASLLLTFFILTSNFTQKEPVIVSTPPSISQIKIPEINVMQILVGKGGRVFFGIDGNEKRIELLRKMGEQYKITFTKEEEKRFSVINSFGVPIEKLKYYIDMKPEDRDKEVNNPGMPIDSLNNQFENWVRYARIVNPKITIAIKADSKTPFPPIKRILDTMNDLREYRFNLITSLEEEPKI